MSCLKSIYVNSKIKLENRDDSLIGHKNLINTRDWNNLKNSKIKIEYFKLEKKKKRNKQISKAIKIEYFKIKENK